MCIICLEWSKGKMTDDEALKAASEYIISEVDETTLSHIENLIDHILESQFL
jgi:hypothetical protein